MTKEKIKIAIDCDDAAIDLKNALVTYLTELKIDVTDLAFSALEKADYPDIGYNLAIRVKKGEFDRGILLCGTGIGMAIVANKVEGIYASPCHDVYSAERLRKSNNAQILTMGSRVVGPELAKMIVSAWLKSEFQGGRSLPKVQKIIQIEGRTFHQNEV